LPGVARIGPPIYGFGNPPTRRIFATSHKTANPSQPPARRLWRSEMWYSKKAFAPRETVSVDPTTIAGIDHRNPEYKQRKPAAGRRAIKF